MVRAKSAPQPALFEDGEVPPAPGKIEQQAFDVYNEIAGKTGWTKANKLSPDRQTKLRKAVHEVGSLVEWRAALERGARSTFLTTKFKPDIEFVCRKPKILKMSEGGYDDPGAAADGKPSLSKLMAPSDTWGQWLRDYKPRGFWPSHLGPRPEEPNCRAPGPMVEAWRKRLGVTVTAPQRETEEQRLTAMVATFRRLEHWDKANAAEERLAALLGRPAVLVPAPDVAGLGMPEKTPHEPRQPAPTITDVDWTQEDIPASAYEEAE